MSKTSGINNELFFFSDNIIEKYFPKVFEFILQSTATSKIEPIK